MRLSIKSLFVSFGGFILLSLAACASSENAADRAAVCKNRFENAEKRFKNKEFSRAKAPLDEILAYCAGTGYMEQAQFLLAETHFNLKEWLEARGEYSSFAMNFPSSPYIETAEYRKAVSSFNMKYHIARDESNTNQAMKDFERFASNYPESPLLDSVNYYLGQLTERLAERDFQIARLYFRIDEPQAAIIYLKEFLTFYPKSKRLKDVTSLLIQSYTLLDQFESARSYLSFAREIGASDKEYQEDINDLEKDIQKAEVKFEKKLKKEQKQKLLYKEESNAS